METTWSASAAMPNVTRSHAGWTEAEDALLFDLAAHAREVGAPLKSVFRELAARTGRRPNSIRNYYYARVKAGDCARGHTPAFIPFTAEESEQLMESVLSAQAHGESVRSCTLRLGGGEQQTMLRYQNKYRALVRTDPPLVRRVMARMQAAGIPTFDPYAEPRIGRVGRPRKQQRSTGDIAREVVGMLSNIEDTDLSALLDSLGRLAANTITTAKKHRQLESEIQRERERSAQLVTLFSELLRINTAFLQSPPKQRSTELSEYLLRLQAAIDPCAKLLLPALG